MDEDTRFAAERKNGRGGSVEAVSEFFLEGALARADEALECRRTFILDEDGWKAFLTALDAPPRPLRRPEKLLREPGFFDGEAGE